MSNSAQMTSPLNVILLQLLVIILLFFFFAVFCEKVLVYFKENSPEMIDNCSVHQSSFTSFAFSGNFAPILAECLLLVNSACEVLGSRNLLLNQISQCLVV